MQPKLTRRSERLLVRELGDETVVYDLASERVTALDATTAAVWRGAEGVSLEALTSATGLSEQDVAAAVVRLEDAELLAKTGFSRRQLLARAGTVAAVGGLVSIAAQPAFAANSTPLNFSLYQLACT